MDLTSQVERAAVRRSLAGVATTALVATEGLLVYLTHGRVASLACAARGTEYSLGQLQHHETKCLEERDRVAPTNVGRDARADNGPR